MTKKSSKRPFRTPLVSPPSRLKIVKPMSWYGEYASYSAGDYLSHLTMELGRLGLEDSQIESHNRPPNTKTVYSDLLKWLSSRPAEAFARLFDWQALNIELMRSRLSTDRNARPRVELSAHITKMNNLSVRWYPGGWRQTEFDWDRATYSRVNLIQQRKWIRPPDFHWFTGDEDPYFDSRPSNELMYIRGVGNLRPQPRGEYGPYATHNSDVVDSILVCAVRSAYEALARELAFSFEVEVIDAFDFVILDEIDESDRMFSSTTHRVIGWSLEDAAQLKLRRDREKTEKQEKQDRSEFDNIAAVHGFAIEQFVQALVAASAKQASRQVLDDEKINRDAAKLLRNNGFSVHAGVVRRIRELLGRYSPQNLPEMLQPTPTEPPPLLSSNIVPFKGTDT